MTHDLLNRIAEEQAASDRIVTGWFLTASQVESIADYLTPHAPHPDVGGLGRFNSVPVFPIDECRDSGDATKTRISDGIRFCFVQMDIVN